MKLEVVAVHPTTDRLCSGGHPWITEDAYTKKFPSKEWLCFYSSKRKQYAIFYNPIHRQKKTFKIWHWADSPWMDQNFFKIIFSQKIEKVLLAKKKFFSSSAIRDHCRLLSGDSDGIFDLSIYKINNNIIIQDSCGLWKKYAVLIASIVSERIGPQNIYWQERFSPHKYEWFEWNTSGLKKLDSIKQFHLIELNLRYLIKINHSYDFGFYGDLFFMRQKLLGLKTKRVLNLFCYTGAFSLPFLQRGNEVVSVDLAKNSEMWFKENLALNQLDTSKWSFFRQDVASYLQQEKTKYDLIICDPPSQFNFNQKRINILKFYDLFLAPLLQCLEEKGHLLLACNTHQITRKKFHELIDKKLKNHQTRVEIVDEIMLEEDYRPLYPFPEGDYLKGLLVRKV